MKTNNTKKIMLFLLILTIIPNVYAAINNTAITSPTNNQVINGDFNLTWNYTQINNETTYLNYYKVTILNPSLVKIKDNEDEIIKEIDMNEYERFQSSTEFYKIKSYEVNDIIENTQQQVKVNNVLAEGGIKYEYTYYDGTKENSSTQYSSSTTYETKIIQNPQPTKRVINIDAWVYVVQGSNGRTIYIDDFKTQKKYYNNQTHYDVELEEEVFNADGIYKLILTTYTNFEEQNSTINITINVNPLVLSFINFTNNPINTYGKITDTNLGTTSFFANTTTVYQTNLTQGIIKVQFGGDNTSENYTQYYEYVNDLTPQNITLTRLEETSDCLYFKVMYSTNTPVDGAYVNIYQAKRINGQTQGWKLIGRRITEEDGYTKFFVDSNKDTKVEVISSGQGLSSNETYFSGELDCSKEAAINIWLTKANTQYANGIYLAVSKLETTNKNANFKVDLQTKGIEKARIVTQYRNYTATPDFRGTIRFNITTLDHNISNNENITFDIYTKRYFREEELTFNDIKIIYIRNIDNTTGTDYVKTDVLIDHVPSEVEEYLGIALLILIILLTIGVQLVIKGVDSGYYLYIIGLGIMGMIIGGWMGYLLVLIVIISTIGRNIIKALIGE